MHTLCVLHLRNQINLRKVGDCAVNSAAAPETRKLRDQRRWNDFMITTSGFNL
jgi:hypothetical protein